MQIKEVLRKNLFINNLQATDKNEVLIQLTNKLYREGYIKDKTNFLEKLEKRENISTTAISNGIAIPHAMSDELEETIVLYAKSRAGVDFKAFDQKPVFDFFLIATPTKSSQAHLKVLANLSKALIKDETQKKLSLVRDFESLLAVFSDKHDDKELTLKNHKNIVAVTACATGIAHTYMASEKLLKTAKTLGYNIKVETNGSSGVENKLNKKDIEAADAVIIASDIFVETDRFAGKPLIFVPVAKAIHQPELLIKKALAADIYKVKKVKEQEVVTNSLYGHLLNGISYMLPFVVGGGILLALAFMLDQVIGVPTNALDRLGSYNVIPAAINNIGEIAFAFMLPVLGGFIAQSIADRPGLVVGFVAGAIAGSGGSGFLGALVGGFLSGFLVNLIKKALTPLPKNLEGIKTILLYPVLGILLVGSLMFLFNIPMKAINDGLNSFLQGLTGSNAAILGLILGVMMAVDLGGPINKAAYLFATGTLPTSGSQGSAVMAAVMAAGMIPPLATFFSTLLFTNKYSEKENQAGMTNLVLGASFITEGAIPFASSDPLRVIPSFAVGAAITGALVMTSNILVNAPHGGVFVIFLVSKPFLYLVYIGIGAFVSGLLLGLFKRSD